MISCNYINLTELGYTNKSHFYDLDQWTNKVESLHFLTRIETRILLDRKYYWGNLRKKVEPKEKVLKTMFWQAYLGFQLESVSQVNGMWSWKK